MENFLDSCFFLSVVLNQMKLFIMETDKWNIGQVKFLSFFFLPISFFLITIDSTNGLLLGLLD